MMRRLLAITAILCFIAVPVLRAQNALSATAAEEIYHPGFDRVPVFRLAHQDNKQLLRDARAAQELGEAPRYASSVAVNLTPKNSGRWTTDGRGRAIWRLRIRSTKAKSLNVGFTSFNLPRGGALYLYDASKTKVSGPFTPADHESHGQLWTPVVPGEEMVVEVQLPEAEKDALELELGYINHDFLGFGAAVSGSCNLDVICGIADGFPQVDTNRDIIQSVGVISTGGGTFCTGFLVNNVRNDCTPLFMTADHCGIGPGNAASLVVYWNFENSICRLPGSPASGGPGDGVLAEFNTGSFHRASHGSTDFTIVELDDPVDAAFNPFMAGWSADDQLPEYAICVHHPGTDEKRISFEDDPCVPDGMNYVEVPDWDLGTTEPGSSGSPLFDEHSRVVGQLQGGGAACGNDLPDFYGWIHASYEGNGTPSTRLKDWIDPDNSGILNIDGKSCAYNIALSESNFTLCSDGAATETPSLTVSDNFGTDVTLSVSGLPAGVTGSFAANPVPPGGTTVFIIGGLSGLATGSYSFTVEGTDGINSGSVNVVINAFAAVPTSVTLLNPVDGATAVSTVANLAWDMLLEAQEYEVQVAEDAAFATIVASATTFTAGDFGLTGLDALSTYYWRVKAINVCGAGSWSDTRSFTTGDIACEQLVAADIPAVIGGGPPNLVESIISISGLSTIDDVDVIGLSGTHSWIEDLTIRLRSPSGTEVILVEQACGDMEDFNVTFDDQATSDIPCPYTDGLAYLPEEPLSAFNGENPNGDWTLQVRDGAFQDGGSLDAWSLRICSVTEGPPVSGIESPAQLNATLFPNPATTSVKVQFPFVMQEKVQFELISLDGKVSRTITSVNSATMYTLDTSKLSAGVWMVRISADGYSSTQKLIIQ